jgi:hypothetical protein
VERARDEKLGAARRFYDSCPAWHRITFITRPKRRENKRLERKAMKSEAPNELVWPVGNRKPHFFYW